MRNHKLRVSQKGLQHAYRSRKEKKRNFRSNWILTINAAARQHELSYSQFIYLLKKSGINLNRKMIAAIAKDEAASFKKLIEILKSYQ